VISDLIQRKNKIAYIVDIQKKLETAA